MMYSSATRRRRNIDPEVRAEGHCGKLRGEMVTSDRSLGYLSSKHTTGTSSHRKPTSLTACLHNMNQKGSAAHGENSSQLEEFKVVIVGDKGCGKTSLVSVYSKGVFPEDHVPTVFDKVVVTSRYRGEPFRLHLYDTAGQEEYDRLRPLSYSDANVVLICYNVMCRSSFENVFVKWFPEVQHFCNGSPIILAGCKSDLRGDRVLTKKLWSSGQNPVTYIQGEEARRRINAVLYLECSARYNENVNELFREATKHAVMATKALEKVSEPRCWCVFL